MVADIASLLITLIDFLLSMSPVVFSAVAAGVEAFIAEEAFERFLSGVNSFMHLEVRFGVKTSTADTLDTYN